MEQYQPAPRTLFDSYFRSADVLLKVYRLLEAENISDHGQIVDDFRQLLAIAQDEAMLCLLNDVFVGVVRERAQLPNGFFQRHNIALLLRQSVVAAYTALEVYLPAVLNRNLPTVIQVKQRWFVPKDVQVKDFLRGFSLSLDDHLRLVEDPETQHEQLGRMLLKYLERRPMANVSGIAVVMKLFGVEDPWDDLGERLGRKPSELRTQAESFFSRRNDIVHRGDREVGSSDSAPRDIDFSWTNTHVDLVKHVVYACDEIIGSRMAEYQQLAAVAITE